MVEFLNRMAGHRERLHTSLLRKLQFPWSNAFLWFSRNLMEQLYVSAIPGREERRASGTSLPVPVESAASCRLLPQRCQKAGGQQHVLDGILTKCQGSPCENRANGRGTGTRRICANLARPRECRMKAESRFQRHFAVRHGTPCGRNPLPASASRGEWLAKGQTGFARGRTPSGAGKALRSLAFPIFLHPQGLPCGKKVSPLRKVVPFFAESDAVFSAKRRYFNRNILKISGL